MAYDATPREEKGSVFVLAEEVQLGPWTTSMKGRLKGNRLAAFANHSAHGDDTSVEEEEAYEAQKAAAKRSLRKEGWAPDDMKMSTETGRLLVTEEMEVLEARAVELVQRGMTTEQRSFVASSVTAAKKLEAIQSYFGGGTVQRRLNIESAMRRVKYVSGPQGSGMRKLVKVMVDFREALKRAKGAMTDDTLMGQIIEKARSKNGTKEKLFSMERHSLKKELNKGALTLDQLRTDLMTAEEQADDEIAQAHGGDAEGAPQLDSAQVTHGGYGQRVQTRTTEDRVELLERVVLGLHEHAQVTQLQDKDKDKGKGKWKHAGKEPVLDASGKKKCFDFLDGKCERRNCRFSHSQ